MPHICDMGPIILLPFWRKACWGFLSPFKNPTASAGFEPANLGIRGQHVTSAPPKLPEHFSYCNTLRIMRQLLVFDMLSILFWTSWSCFMFEVNLQLLQWERLMCWNAIHMRMAFLVNISWSLSFVLSQTAECLTWANISWATQSLVTGLLTF
jgi:hypothetical protein